MLTDEQYLSQLGMAYGKYLSTQRDEDYIINQPQMDKLCEILNFFSDMALEGASVKVQPLKLIPKERNAWVTVRCIVLDVNGVKDCQKFGKLISYCSAYGVDVVNEDHIDVQFTVPDVFTHK